MTSIDFVEHHVNGWKVDIEDYEAICCWAGHVLGNSNNLNNILKSKRKNTELNCYKSQEFYKINYRDLLKHNNLTKFI